MKESKIYSAVDAEECIQFLGQEGYFGNSLKEIKAKRRKGFLIKIRGEETIYRYRKSENTEDFTLFQPIIAEYRKIKTIKEAETFFHKKIKSKDGQSVFIADYAFINANGVVRLNYIMADKLVSDYIVDKTGEPVGIKE